MMNMFREEELIRVAKRENNNRRSYLYVNPLQGKHLPVSPSKSLELFSAMARRVESSYRDERVLLIGFAETATAIGAAIAECAGSVDYYMNTTREDVPGTAFLYFSESHSHATEQRLAVRGLERILGRVDRIVFAEDEVTTGKTIEKLIRVLRQTYGEKGLRFGIISVLNSMPEDRVLELAQDGIVCDALCRMRDRYRTDEIERYTYQTPQTLPAGEGPGRVSLVQRNGGWNCRLSCDVQTIRAKTAQFTASALDSIPSLASAGSVLVLGTEECMYPGMKLGAEIERRWPEKRVRFHATTRSPIEVSQDEGYPLFQRSPLVSFYAEDRRTFLYNLDRYDRVLIVTDAQRIVPRGLSSLALALEHFGNSEITVIQWGEFDHAEQLSRG